MNDDEKWLFRIEHTPWLYAVPTFIYRRKIICHTNPLPLKCASPEICFTKADGVTILKHRLVLPVRDEDGRIWVSLTGDDLRFGDRLFVYFNKT